MAKQRIAVVYHYFAHYREPVLTELGHLCDEAHSALHFYGALESNEPNLKTMSFPDGRFTALENRWLFGFLWQRGMLGEVKAFQPTHVIFLGQFNFLSTWVAAIWLRASGVKVLFWGHGFYGNEGFFKLLVRRFFNRLPHKHLVYGHRAKNLMARGQPAPHINVVYNSLDYDKQSQLFFDHLERVAPVEVDQKCECRSYGVFIGRLTSVKRLDLILYAVQAVCDRGIAFSFIFVGDGPEMETLLALRSELALDEVVQFVGACHDEEKLADIIANACVCVSPGNVGLTAIHSLTYGTPVITNNDFANQMPEFEAIEDGVNGGFFEAGNLMSLVQTIVPWVGLTESERQAVALSCRKIVEHKYNPKTQARLISSALENCP